MTEEFLKSFSTYCKEAAGLSGGAHIDRIIFSGRSASFPRVKETVEAQLNVKMNKLFGILLLLFIASANLQAQDNTIKKKQKDKKEQKDKKAQEEKKALEEKNKKDWVWWHYALIVLAAGGAGFCAWMLLKSRKNDSDESKRELFNRQGNANNKNDEEMWSKHPHQQGAPKETVIEPSNFGNRNELVERLNRMEINQQGEIKRLQSEKKDLETKLKKIENDKSTLISDLQMANAEKNRFQNEIEKLNQRVIVVDFLKEYSETVFSYLEFCQRVSEDAYSVFNLISRQNPEQAFATGHLLIKFQDAVNSIPVGDWMRTLRDIKDSGAITNRQLAKSFVQLQNNKDKEKEFQRSLFSEVLVKYSNHILILAEAFKNLSRFQASTDSVTEAQAQSLFGKHVTEIVNKAKATGLTIKHVSLFENWEQYLGEVENNSGERSSPYKGIGGLERGAIAEIVSYGVETPLGDNTKTIIIISAQ